MHSWWRSLHSCWAFSHCFSNVFNLSSSSFFSCPSCETAARFFSIWSDFFSVSVESNLFSLVLSTSFCSKVEICRSRLTARSFACLALPSSSFVLFSWSACNALLGSSNSVIFCWRLAICSLSSPAVPRDASISRESSSRLSCKAWYCSFQFWASFIFSSHNSWSFSNSMSFSFSADSSCSCFDVWSSISVCNSLFCSVRDCMCVSAALNFCSSSDNALLVFDSAEAASRTISSCFDLLSTTSVCNSWFCSLRDSICCSKSSSFELFSTYSSCICLFCSLRDCISCIVSSCLESLLTTWFCKASFCSVRLWMSRSISSCLDLLSAASFCNCLFCSSSDSFSFIESFCFDLLRAISFWICLYRSLRESISFAISFLFDLPLE